MKFSILSINYSKNMRYSFYSAVVIGILFSVSACTLEKKEVPGAIVSVGDRYLTREMLSQVSPTVYPIETAVHLPMPMCVIGQKTSSYMMLPRKIYRMSVV